MQNGTTYAEIIGYVIRTMREKQKITQAQMAEMMGMTQSAWSNLESGSSTLSIIQIAKIAKILNQTVQEITASADGIMEELEKAGVKIKEDKKEASKLGLILLGVAGIATALAFMRKK